MTNADTWIGLNDQSEEGNWDSWNSGAPVTYSNWAPGKSFSDGIHLLSI